MSEENARGNQNCPTHDAGASSRDSSRADTGGSADAVAQREQTGQGARLTESDGRAADNSSDSSLQDLVNNIDAETLEQRRRRTSTTDRKEMPSCPECGSVKLHHKVEGASPVRKAGEYRCGNCGEHFDEPITPDGDQEVATDGGVPVPEQIAAATEASDYPELSIREVMDEADLTKAQVVSTAGSMDRLELDRSLGVVRLHEDDGGEFVDDYEDELVTDGGEALSESLKTALENADCHPDMVRYAEKAAERGGTPILGSLRRFHDVSDVSRIETVGTLIERSLWKDGAEATLRRHGHADKTNAEILQEIIEQQPVTDGGQPAGLDEAELRIRTARANIAGLIPIFGMGIQTAQKVDVVTDGGRRGDWRRRDVDAARSDAGVGDQTSGGCPHADGALPCWDCLTNGAGGDSR